MAAVAHGVAVLHLLKVGDDFRVFFIKFYPSQRLHKGVWTCGARLNKFRGLNLDFDNS